MNLHIVSLIALRLIKYSEYHRRSGYKTTELNIPTKTKFL